QQNGDRGSRHVADVPGADRRAGPQTVLPHLLRAGGEAQRHAVRLSAVVALRRERRHLRSRQGVRALGGRHHLSRPGARPVVPSALGLPERLSAPGLHPLRGEAGFSLRPHRQGAALHRRRRGAAQPVAARRGAGLPQPVLGLVRRDVPQPRTLARRRRRRLAARKQGGLCLSGAGARRLSAPARHRRAHHHLGADLSAILGQGFRQSRYRALPRAICPRQPRRRPPRAHQDHEAAVGCGRHRVRRPPRTLRAQLRRQLGRRADADPYVGDPGRRAQIDGGAGRSVSRRLRRERMGQSNLAGRSMTDFSSLTLTGAARASRNGEIAAEAYATALLDRCDAVAHLNAFIVQDRDAVLAASRDADRKRASGARLGALHGVPLAIKDNLDCVGYATTGGTPALRDNRPKRNAAVMQKLLDAGAIVLGKANMHEMAFGITSNNGAFGPARNPYDPARVPGGSSGGTGTAIGARLAPAGIGTDTGGSVRIPAAFCGIAGLRPSLGRWPIDGILPISPTRDTAGPMARTVTDLALLDAVVTGSVPPTPSPL